MLQIFGRFTINSKILSFSFCFMIVLYRNFPPYFIASSWYLWRKKWTCIHMALISSCNQTCQKAKETPTSPLSTEAHFLFFLVWGETCAEKEDILSDVHRRDGTFHFSLKGWKYALSLCITLCITAGGWMLQTGALEWCRWRDCVTLENVCVVGVY